MLRSSLQSVRQIGWTIAAGGPEYEPESQIVSRCDMDAASVDFPMISLVDCRPLESTQQALDSARSSVISPTGGLLIAVEALIHALAEKSISFARPLGLKRDESSSSHTTASSSSGLRIGLHIDNWFRQTIGSRYESPNRIALNLGPGSRELLFCDTNPFWAWAARSFGTSACVGTPQFRVWLAKYGPAAVYSLRVDPGFAYCAPTEWLAHDGSTFGEKLPSYLFSILGSFSP